jgi:TATA-binding protein-associated factor
MDDVTDTRLRKLNQQAAGVSTPSSAPPTASNTPAPSPSQKTSSLPSVPGSIIIDPGAKARGNGGAIEPVVDGDGNAITASKPLLTHTIGTSPWATTLELILPSLADPGWQARHGAALACIEIVRSVPIPSILLPIARQLLLLLALDRFGDFLGDTVVAPVRETAAQALGVVLKYMDDVDSTEVHGVLMAMVEQTWAKRGKEAEGLEKCEKFSWELRHAGLLGLKYEIAVKIAPEGKNSKEKPMEIDIKPDVEGMDIIRDVVRAAVLA